MHSLVSLHLAPVDRFYLFLLGLLFSRIMPRTCDCVISRKCDCCCIEPIKNGIQINICIWNFTANKCTISVHLVSLNGKDVRELKMKKTTLTQKAQGTRIQSRLECDKIPFQDCLARSVSICLFAHFNRFDSNSQSTAKKPCVRAFPNIESMLNQIEIEIGHFIGYGTRQITRLQSECG